MFGHIAQMPDESDTKQILTASPFGDLEETTGTPPYYAANLIVRVYLHSFFCVGLRKKHIFYKRVRIARSRSSKVDDFGTNRKRICIRGQQHKNLQYL